MTREAYTRLIRPRYGHARTRKDRGVERLSRCFDGLSLEKDEKDSAEKAEGHEQLVLAHETLKSRAFIVDRW